VSASKICSGWSMIFVEVRNPLQPTTAPAGQYIAPPPGRRPLQAMCFVQTYRTAGASGMPRTGHYVCNKEEPSPSPAPAGQYIAPQPGRRSLSGAHLLQRFRTSGAVCRFRAYHLAEVCSGRSMIFVKGEGSPLNPLPAPDGA